MADVKVSALPALAAGDLDLVNDFIMVGDASAGQSKRMAPGEMIRAAIPFLSSFYDFTVGVLPAGVAFTRASTAWRWNSSGVLVPATTDVARFQYDPSSLLARGLLVEGAATNGIRNSVAAGAVAGSPGTLPTRWQNGGDVGTGINRTIVGSASEDGIDGVDINFAGTSVSAAQLFAIQETTTGIAATVGQTFTVSQFLRLIAGSATGINVTIGYLELNSGGTIVATKLSPTLAIAAAALKTQRFSYTGATTAATCAYVQPFFRISFASGVTLNGTYRIGSPQMVAASEATSPIVTTGAAATRAADVALITNPQVLADQAYIIKARTASYSPASGLVQPAFQVDDGTANNRRAILRSSDNHLHVIATMGGVDQCDLDLGTVANDTDFAVAIRWADNKFAASLNGGAIVTDLSGANPLGLTTARVGRNSSGDYWAGTIRAIETRRTVTDAELPLLAA